MSNSGQMQMTLVHPCVRIRKCPPTLLPRVQNLLKFGPFYSRGEDDVMTRTANEAWQHVKEKTGIDSSETEETYMTAIGGRIESDARNIYVAFDGNEPPLEVENMDGGQFKQCLIRHGCLFLLAVLELLGAEAHLLGYSNNQFIWNSNFTGDRKRIAITTHLQELKFSITRNLLTFFMASIGDWLA